MLHNVPNYNKKLLLAPENKIRDLVVLVTPDRFWSTHIRSIVTKATKAASWYLSVFRTGDHHTMLTLFKSLVRSHLEYCCPLWTPHNSQGDIKLLEGVQRSFTAKIIGYSDMNYWDRLVSLRLSSLQRRRERYILISMWKILNGLAPNSINVKWCHNDRLGIRAILPTIPISRSKLSTLKVRSLSLAHDLPNTQ